MSEMRENMDLCLARLDQAHREIDLLRAQLEVKESQNWSLRQEMQALKVVLGRMQADREFSL